MLLQPVSESNSAPKIGIFGPAASGKTLTSMLIAIGMSKELYGSAPLAFVDPEGVSEFIRKVCAIEQVPLLVLPSRTFVEMRDGLAEAETVGACGFVVDHYDSIFRELTEAQKQALGLTGRRLPYSRREELQMIWDAWVRQFRASPVACVFNGRLSWEWGDTEDENGDPTFVKLGAKMRGESDAGYEPNLLIELEAIQDKTKRQQRTRAKTGGFTHYAHVLKDRRMILNGLSFKWQDLNGYKAGDYQTVFRAFAPHFSGGVGGGGLSDVDRRTVGAQSHVSRSSTELFAAATGESASAERARRVLVAKEEFEATSAIMWPGSSNDAKACRAAAIEAVFKCRSESAVAHKSAEDVEAGAALLRRCEAEWKTTIPQYRADVIASVQVIADRVAEATVL